MNTFLRCSILAVSLSTVAAFAEEATSSSSSRMKEVIKEAVVQDAKKPGSAPAPSLTPVTASADGSTAPVAATPIASPTAPGAEPAKAAAATTATTTTTTTTAAATAKPAKPPATTLPKVEVRKNKITELDLQLQKQDQAIAREKKNAKPTQLDATLNDPKLSKKFSLFGGNSSDHRAEIADERVYLMEQEKDLMVEIAQARTPEEKKELQKQLDDLKAARRDLEDSMR